MKQKLFSVLFLTFMASAAALMLLLTVVSLNWLAVNYFGSLGNIPQWLEVIGVKIFQVSGILSLATLPTVTAGGISNAMKDDLNSNQMAFVGFFFFLFLFIIPVFLMLYNENYAAAGIITAVNIIGMMIGFSEKRMVIPKLFN